MLDKALVTGEQWSPGKGGYASATVVDVVRGRWETFERERAYFAELAKSQRPTVLWIASEPKPAGRS